MEQITEEMNQLNAQIQSLFPAVVLDLDMLFGLLMRGKITDVIKILMQNTGERLYGEFGSFAKLAVMLFCVSLLSALLLNLMDLFENRQLGDIGFYFAYLFLMLILLRIFESMTGSAQALLGDVVLFLKLFLPVYFLAVGAAAGVTTALFYYQFILIFIYGMEMILQLLLMPLIKVYIFLAFMNGLWKEERLSLFLEFLKRMAGGIQKIFFAVITGIGILHSMITPVIDSVRLSAVQKAIGMIPGIGTVGSSAAEMVLGSAVLIKNSVGVLTVLLLAGICAVPILKIWLLSMFLKGLAAVSGIVSDKRMTACMDDVGEGGFLVLRTLLTACGLLFITLAIAAMSTNRGF